ncbi:MAG: ankyrin repeat domain-containing protein [Pseudomonadota bacterium]|nr:ankyrin repeat domain-containing protein [Pseudomonadota bacterium]
MQKEYEPVKMKKSPVFTFLECIKQKKISGLKLSFADSLECKQKINSSDYYYFVSLAEIDTHVMIDQTSYIIKQNHMSIYQKFQEHEFGLTTYHYTAELRDDKRQQFLLHVYYDQFGNYCHHLFQRQERQQKITISILDHTSVIAISGQYVLPLICEINKLLDTHTENVSQKIHQHQMECEELSRGLFSETAEKHSDKIRAVYAKYCRATGDYHNALMELNSISFDPNHGTVNRLGDIYKKLQSNEILNDLLARADAAVKPVKVASKKQLVAQASPPVTKIEKPKPETSQKSLQPTETKDILGELKTLRGVESAKALVRKHELTSRLIQLTNDSQLDRLIRYFTDLDELAVKAQNKILELIEHNKVSDIRLLFKIAGEVTSKMVIKAALANAHDTLDFILSKYKKCLDLMVKISPLIMQKQLSFKTLEKLLKKGANPNMVDVQGQTSLMVASARGDIQKISLLLKYNAFVNCRRIKPSSIIIIYGPNHEDNKATRDELTELLQVPSDYSTALFYAMEEGHIPIVRLLLEHGAKLEMQVKTGFPAYAMCCAISNIFNPLNDNGRELMRYTFMELRCDINMLMGAPGFQATPLHYAGQFNAPDYVAALLNLGANPNIRRSIAQDRLQCVTPIALCASKGFINIVKLYLEHENVKLTINTLAETLLCSNDKSIDDQLVELMLDRFINETLKEEPTAINKLYGTSATQTTMLHFAIMFGKLSSAKHLMQLGADIYIRTLSNVESQCLTVNEIINSNPVYQLAFDLYDSGVHVVVHRK